MKRTIFAFCSSQLPNQQERENENNSQRKSEISLEVDLNRWHKDF